MSFKDLIRYNPKSLNPKSFQGADFIPNVLRYLGINQSLLSNPKIYEEIKQRYQKFEDSGEEIKKLKETYVQDPSSENLQAYMDYLKKCRVLNLDETKFLYDIGNDVQMKASGIYRNMSVDPKTGSVTFQKIIDNPDDGEQTLTTFDKDAKGNFVVDKTTIVTDKRTMVVDKEKLMSGKRSQTLREDNSDKITRQIITVNPDGIQVRNQFIGENNNLSIERDEKNPFILKWESDGKQLFYVMRDDFNNLNRGPSGRMTDESFATRENALKHFKDVESLIALDIKAKRVRNAGLRKTSFYDPDLESTLDSITKLAQKSGLHKFEAPGESVR